MITIIKTHFNDSIIEWSTTPTEGRLRLSIEYDPRTFCSKCIAGESCFLCLPGYTIRWYKGTKRVEISGQVTPGGASKKARKVITNVVELSNFWDKENLPKKKSETKNIMLEVKALLEETGLSGYDLPEKSWYTVKEE